MDVILGIAVMCALFAWAWYELDQSRREDERRAQEDENAYYDAMSQRKKGDNASRDKL